MMQADKVADISYDNLLKNYVPAKTKYPLAVYAKSAPMSIFSVPVVIENDANPNIPSFLSMPLKQSEILAIADADMMSEIEWQKHQPNSNIVINTSDNLLFLRNAIDYMVQSPYASIPAKKISDPQNEIKSDDKSGDE